MAAADKTKLALAQALKELMKTLPLEKISVGQITQTAQMGRNTFYYHFRDKYDLVNWIFETESAPLLEQEVDASNWTDFLDHVERYLQQNLAFYQNALQYSGQNSLQDYIYDVFEKRIEERVRLLDAASPRKMREDEIRFAAGFFASALQGLLLRGVRLGLLGELGNYRECVRRICNGRMIEDYIYGSSPQEDRQKREK